MSVAGTTPESGSLRAFREGYEEFIRVLNAGDYELAFARVSDDFEFHPGPDFPEREIRGRAAMIEFWRGIRASMPDWELNPRQYIEAGPDTYVVRIEAAGSGQASGIPVSRDVWQVVELEHGVAVRLREFWERSEALAAAGLEDPE